MAVTSERPPQDNSAIQNALLHLHRLFRKEMELMKAEVSDRISRAAIGVAMIAVAGILALIGLNVLAGAVVALLAELGMTAGWASLTVAAVTLLIAVGLVLRGLNILKTTSLAPRNTLNALERDAEILKETIRDA